MTPHQMLLDGVVLAATAGSNDQNKRANVNNQEKNQQQ